MTTPELPNGWRGPVAQLDKPTSDHRMLATPADGVKTRAYPLTLTRNHVGDPTGYPTIGSVDHVWVDPDTNCLMGEGQFDLGGEDGRNAARQLANGMLNRVSIDPVEVEGEMRYFDADDKPMTFAAGDEPKSPEDLPEGAYAVTTFTNWTLAGLAMVPIPAYTQAAVEPVYGYQASGALPTDAIVAAVGGQIFQKALFADPKLEGPTPMTVADDGHVFGHIRLSGTCYQYGGGQGNGGFCLEPPVSACNYAKFMVHGAKMDDGSILAVGALTFGDGHVSRGGLEASRAHYDDVATIAAKGVVGDDDFGTWFSGEVVSEYSERAYDLLLSPLSGHWEPDADNGNHLELLAAHIVVTPGYSVPRIVASFGEDASPSSLILTTTPVPQPILASVETSVSEISPRKALLQAAIDLKRADELAKRIGVDAESRAARAKAQVERTDAILAASGGSHIAATSTPWDGGSAGASILAHATKNGKIDVGVASQGFLAHVGDGSKRGDWKLPVARVVAGVVQIVPRGVSAAASRVGQTQGIDQDAAKSKIASLYRQIHSADSSWPASPDAN